MRQSTRKKLATILVGGALLCGAPLAAQETDLTFDEARAIGQQAAINGDIELALALSSSLLQADPTDSFAWLIRSSALLQAQEHAAARDAAAEAHRNAPSGPLRYEAARLAALAATNEERFTIATWWLRRALIDAPNEAETERTLQDAAIVSSRNPWQTSVQLSFQPSDNVNGGVDEEFFEINGINTFGALSRDSQPLSGWTSNLSFSTRYRLSQSEDHQTFVGLRANFRGVILSDESREELSESGRPTSNSDYSYGTLSTFWSRDNALEVGDWGLEASVGARWLYGDWDETFVRVGVNRSIPLSDYTLARGSLWAEVNSPLDDRDDVQKVGAVLSYTEVFPDIAVVSSTIGYTEAMSDFINARSSTWFLAVSAQPLEQIGPAQVTVQAGFQIADYPDWTFFTFGTEIEAGRQDETLFANIDLAFPDMSFAGFEPVVTLESSSTTSNVNRFERESFGIGLTFQSSF
ncbi:MAG: hypothetical protein AB8B85_11570 [Paracoccaceae bacterium]